MARAGDGVTIRAREREVDITVTLTFTGYPEAEGFETADQEIKHELSRLPISPDQVDVETSNEGPWR